MKKQPAEPHLMNCLHSSDGWCLECVKALHDESEQKSAADELLLVRAYRSMCRAAWQDGETLEEIRTAINDHLSNRYGPLWDKQFLRKRKVNQHDPR